MMSRRYKQEQVLKYNVPIKVNDKEEYDRLVAWIRENVPTTDRLTPEWRGSENMWGVSYNQPLKFEFRYEEYAMAFKLILNDI